jgi:hypothetical protein
MIGMSNVHRWFIAALAAVGLAAALAWGAGALATIDEECCSAAGTDRLAARIDEAVRSFDSVPLEMRGLATERREELARAAGTLQDLHPGFSLVPATLGTASELLAAAHAGRPSASLESRTSRLLAAALESAARNAAFMKGCAGAAPALAGCCKDGAPAATKGDACCTSGSPAAASAEGSCPKEGVTAAGPPDAVVARADQLLARWAEASKTLAALDPEAKGKVDQALRVGSTSCPVGRRMANALALAREALSKSAPPAAEASDAAPTAQSPEALVRKAAALLDAAGASLAPSASATGAAAGGCCGEQRATGR